MKESLDRIISKAGLPRIQATARSQMVQGAMLSLAAWGAINIATWFFFGAKSREFLSSLTTDPGGNIVFLLYGGLVLGAVMLVFAMLAFISRSTTAIILNGFSLIAIGIWNIIHDFVAMQALRPYGYTLETGPVSFWAMFGIIQIGWGFQQFSSYGRSANWSPARLGAAEEQKIKGQLQDFVRLKESIAEGIVKASITTSVLGMLSRTTQFTGRLLEDSALMVSEKLDDIFTIDRKAMRAVVFPNSNTSPVSVSVPVGHSSMTLDLGSATIVAFKAWCGIPLTMVDFQRLAPPGKKGAPPSLKMLTADLLKPFLDAEDGKLRAIARAALDTLAEPAPGVKTEIPQVPEDLLQEPIQVVDHAPAITVSELVIPATPEQEEIPVLPESLPEAKPALEILPLVEVEDRTLPPREQTLLCPHCRQEHLVSMSFCPMTGKKINLQAYCPQCGKHIEPDWSHCGYCGQPLFEARAVTRRPKAQAIAPSQASVLPLDAEKPRARTPRKFILLVAGGVGLVLTALVIAFSAKQNASSSQVAPSMILTTSTAPQSVFSFPTATSLPSPSADTNTAPLGAGWRSFTVSDFYLTLPERWVSVDVNRETIKSILYSAENLNPEWVQNVIAQVSANDFPEMTKFWAMDAQPAGGVYALGNVALWVFSSPQSSESVCVEMPPVYQEMGVELLKAECGLEINQLDVARLTTRHTLPSLTVMQDEYYYVRENKSWVLTLSVEATQYENFSEIFDTIAGSFRLVDDHLAADPTALTPYREAGGKIAFASDRDGNLEIYVMDADGGNPTRLTDNPAEDTDPSLSPDGQKIVFASARDGNWEIYVMNADGSDTIRLTDHPAREADPAWSPDGQKIVFSSNRDGDSTLNSVNSEIYVMAADGSAPTRLTYDPADDSIPNWSPDMEKIVFNSNRDGDGNIYIMNADGSNQIRITSDPGVDGYPVWSPDGQWIVYNTNRDGNWEIYGVSADGSVQTNLSNDPADDGFPEWSANGQKIVFSSARNGNWEIYLMNADGSDPAPLTNDPGYDSYPDLSSLTDQGGNQSSLAPSTATPVPALPQGPSPTAIQFVSIVSHEDLLTSLSALWLEFAILPGDILPGSQIEAALDNGFLELTLPGGEVKTFPQVPPATSDLKAASFENYGSVPSGPQIRIPLETLADISMVGRYQVTWQSGMMHSNTVTFEWDGTQIIVFEP